MIEIEMKGRQQFKNGRHGGHYAIVNKNQKIEKPIGQAQISLEAYRTVSTYTNIVRG